MYTKKVSIIMPIYNASLYMGEAIKSILEQSYTNFELIIVNDNSSDDSKELALLWAKKDKRIVVIDNKYEKGIHGASNTAIDIAKGDFIAKADSDDIQNLKRIEIQVKFLEKNTKIDLIGSGYETFGDKIIKNQKIFHPTNILEISWKMLTDLYFCNPSTMYRKSILKNIPYYPNVVCEDFAFLSKVIKKHRCKNLKKILVKYRQHNHNYSNTSKTGIELSTMDIFRENYLYYTQSLENHEIFYKFHKKNELDIKDILKVIKKSIIISKKIIKQYDSNNLIYKYIYISILISIHIIKALFKYYYKKIFIKK